MRNPSRARLFNAERYRGLTSELALFIEERGGEELRLHFGLD